MSDYTVYHSIMLTNLLADRVDLESGITLAMSAGSLVLFATLFLEYHDLLVATMIHYGRRNFARAITINQQIIEFDCAAGFCGQRGDTNGLPLLDQKLFSTGFYYTM